MATWPSGSKASTNNVDAGTDSPSSARADLKQAIDNQNQIIDMFNIATPSDGQILKYNNSNSRFELAADASIGTINDLNDVNIVLPLSDGQVLAYNSTSSQWENTSVSAGLDNIVEDTTPQLGGNLDVNGNSIVSASNGDIAITPNGTGKIVLDNLNWPTADGAANAFLKTDGSANLSFATIIQATGNELENIVEDTTPQLGGNLDVNGNSIVSSSNGDITLTPNGTGRVVINGNLQIDGTTTTVNSTTLDVDDINITIAKGAINAAAADGGGITLEGPAVAATLNYASADDSWNFNKKTSAPELQVDNININANAITSTNTNGDISITPNGTGAVIVDGNEFPQTQGAVGQILVADGSGLLEWANQEKLTAKVINADSVTINKGQPVYVFSAQGDLISVKLAVNTGDATSAQTLGLAADSIAANAEGLVVCQGVLTNVDTSTYTAGQGLYLGATAGAITATKPYAPNHIVYLGFVEKVNATSGRIYVRVQNGYELDEIHDVDIDHTQPLASADYLTYNGTTGLWQNAPLAIEDDTAPVLGGNLDVGGFSIVSTANGDITLTPNGTGQVVIDGLSYPSADGTNGQVLTTDGAGNLSFTTVSGGGGSSTLDGLTDVVITAAATDDILRFDGTNWVDTAAADITVGTATNANNINISTTNGNASEGTMYIPLVSNFATGNQTPHLDDGLFYDSSTNTLSASTFSGNFSGSDINSGAVAIAYGGTGKTTAPAANAALNGFTTTGMANGTTTLTNTSSVYQIFTAGGGSTAQTVRLPSTNTLQTGWSFHIVNNSTGTGSLTIQTSSAVSLGTVPPGVTVMVTCIDIASNNASAWEMGYTDFSTITGTGSVVLSTSPTLTTPNLGTPSAIVLTNASGTASININGSVGATTRSTGAFTTLTADTTTLDDIRETVFAIGNVGSITLTPNAANGSIQTITATGNFTMNAFASPVSGQTITFVITQDATGGRTLTSTMRFANGSKTLSTAANAIDILTVSYIGTTYYASLAKGFI